MIVIEIYCCGWCKRYTGLEDGWKMCCEAFPDGLPLEFTPDPEKPCKNEMGFVVDQKKEKEYLELFG